MQAYWLMDKKHIRLQADDNCDAWQQVHAEAKNADLATFRLVCGARQRSSTTS